MPKGVVDIEAVHDEVRIVYDHKMNDEALKKIGDAMHTEMQGYLAQQRQVNKLAAHAATYGVSVNKGTTGHTWPNMRFTNKTPRPKTAVAKQARSIEKLDQLDRFWAKAFYDVMNVKADFFAQAAPPRRRFLREHYTEMAKETSKRGERAQKVLAYVVSYQLERGDEPAPWPVDPDVLARMQHRTVTGRTTFHMPSYQNLPKHSEIKGRSFKTGIVDETTELK